MKATEDLDLENWLLKINKSFYDKVYSDDWLKQVFAQVPQDYIVAQQVDFMLQAMGGPHRYAGRNPGEAHPHIYITEEMWAHREHLLAQAFDEVQAPVTIKEKWFKIDSAFKARIVMKDPGEMKPRFPSDDLLNISNPNKLKKVA
jgi:hemoglobin